MKAELVRKIIENHSKMSSDAINASNNRQRKDFVGQYR